MLRRLKWWWLKRQTAHATADYLGGLAAYADECVKRRQEAGVLCPMGTPGCRYTDCGPWAGYACSGPNAPRHVDMGR